MHRPHPKRRRNLSDSEVEDIDSSDDESVNPLAGQRTLLVSGVSELTYPEVLLRLRSLRVSIAQDDAPLCPYSGVMAIGVDTNMVDLLFEQLEDIWSGPGTLSVGVFNPAPAGEKLAIRAPKGPDGSAVVVCVTAKSVAEYARSRGAEVNASSISLNMVSPGTWQVQVADQLTAAVLLSLQSVVISSVELGVGHWLDAIKEENQLKVIVRNLSRLTSRKGLSTYMSTHGDITDILHGKLASGMFAPFSIFTFKDAEGRDRALAKNGKKKMDGHVLVIVRALSADERAVEARRKEEKRRARASATSYASGSSQEYAQRRAHNREAIVAYEKAAALAEAARCEEDSDSSPM